jgi:hypothetical protein
MGVNSWQGKPLYGHFGQKRVLAQALVTLVSVTRYRLTMRNQGDIRA